MQINRNSIVAVSLCVEAFLATLFFIWSYYKGFSFNLIPSIDAVINGVLFCFPLFALSFIFFGPLADRFEFLSGCCELREKVVKPLAHELKPFTALIIAFCAGFGEELFFRGLVLNELGIILSSVLFALIHFGFAVRYYLIPVLIYVAIGFYFAFLATEFGLWTAIFTHVFYDFVVLVVMGKTRTAIVVSEAV